MLERCISLLFTSKHLAILSHMVEAGQVPTDPVVSGNCLRRFSKCILKERDELWGEKRSPVSDINLREYKNYRN